MAMRHNPFPKIPQFRQVIKEIRHQAAYLGQNDDGEPIYDHNPTYPVIQATGTIKLHGTNAGISWSRETGLYTQSRNNSIPVGAGGHFGFPVFVLENQDFFLEEMEALARIYSVSAETITIFGEWAGEGIQKNVAISELKKQFFPFEVKIKDFEKDESRYVGTDNLRSSPLRGIYPIQAFETFDIEIDFSRPQEIQNELIEITNTVEKLCPVSRQLGASGIGEGVVYRFEHKGEVYRFKVKGEEHSVTKVKTLAAVDTEKLASVNAFVDYAVTEQRVTQAMVEEDARDRRATGDVMRWIANDIQTEEADTMMDNNLEWKDVARPASDKARRIFFDLLDHLETFPG